MERVREGYYLRDGVFVYEGEAPFLFVGYSRQDETAVRAVLARLTKDRRRRLRVWLDYGVRSSFWWKRTVAQRICEAHAHLFFLSPSAMGSPHVRKELYMATGRGTPHLVELAPFEFPPEFELDLAPIQRVSIDRAAERLSQDLPEVLFEPAPFQTPTYEVRVARHAELRVAPSVRLRGVWYSAITAAVLALAGRAWWSAVHARGESLPNNNHSA